MLGLLKKNNSREYVYIICILISLSSIGNSQDKSWLFSFKKNPVNSNNMWIEKNNFGRDVSDYNFDTHFQIKQSNFTYVFNIFSNVNQQKVENIYLHESFVKYKVSDKTFLRIGQYYRDFSQYLNDELSSGSMLISHNAEPMPKIGLVTSAKIKKYPKIKFNFGVAHGEFEKNDYYDKKPLLHEKFIYLNVKKDNYKFGVGLVHEAMWGGSTFLGGDEPSEFKDFLKIIISADGPLIDGQSHVNALGNHLGLWDFYYQKNYNNQILKLYYQHFFEDTSGLRFHNRFDGLWGLELNNYIPDTTILLEYLDTSNQNIDPPYVSESYYSHGTYRLGWSYKNYILGNPFVSNIETKFIHLGVKGRLLSNYQYKVKGSRRIDINEKFNYKIEIIKTISPNYNINLFILNNNKDKRGIGFGISKIL